jgi:para-nitrobenzyl esterase
MEDYFANFIKTGNPNGNNLPQWGLLQNGQFMVIGVDSHTQPVNDARFLFLNQFFDQSRPVRH